MFSLVVFDLDGTLVDSRQDIAESANALLQACGAPRLSDETIGRMVGNGAPTLVARAFAAAGGVPPPDAVEQFLAIYEARLLEHTRPYPAIPDVLEALGARTPLAVLTNKPLAATRAILTGLDLARFFAPEAVVGGDSPLGRKPDPAGLLHLAARFGAPPAATLLVGDSVVDWRAAHNAAARVCLARYGFGFIDFPVDELTAEDRVIDAPHELLAL
jgi:phosphoglycolate phosphatase